MYNSELENVVIPVELLKIKKVKGYGENAKPMELCCEGKLLYSYLKMKYEDSQRNNETLVVLQDYLADLFGISIKTIQRKMAILVAAGLIKIRYTYRVNIYTIFDYYKEDFENKEEDITEVPSSKTNISTNPCQFYIQKLSAPFFECLKFGIAYDTEMRSQKQHTSSMFSHKIIHIWDIQSRRFGLDLENLIKRNFKHSGCLKVWMPDGYTETACIEDINEIVMFIENQLK